MKKHFLLLLLALCALTTQAQRSLTPLWTTDTTLKVPESVLFDATNSVLYVSQINGKPAEKNGNGSIAKVGLDGKITNGNWVSGLNAPKGLGRNGNRLFVADLSEVVEIDIKTGRIIRKIPVEGARFLNDITVSEKGIVYVSDSDTKKVHRIENGQVSTYLDNLTRPNGLLALGNDLLVLDSGKLLKADAQKKLSTLAEGMHESTDGIEQISPGEYLVSTWNGNVYIVKGSTVEKMLDLSGAKINTADIGYDARSQVVYVPTFYKNSVMAFKVQ